MEQYNLKIGKTGEIVARSYLIKSGYTIIATNARISHKEIDLIVQKNKEFRFIEVKTTFYSNISHNLPEDYLSQQKISTLTTAIYEYCLILAKKEENISLDLIAVTILPNKVANISHFKNIF